MVKRLKGEVLEMFNKLMDAAPTVYGEHPPTDAQLADSHQQDCLCSHCTSLESPEHTEKSNDLWEQSILNNGY